MSSNPYSVEQEGGLWWVRSRRNESIAAGPFHFQTIAEATVNLLICMIELDAEQAEQDVNNKEEVTT